MFKVVSLMSNEFMAPPNRAGRMSIVDIQPCAPALNVTGVPIRTKLDKFSLTMVRDAAAPTNIGPPNRHSEWKSCKSTSSPKLPPKKLGPSGNN